MRRLRRKFHPDQQDRYCGPYYTFTTFLQAYQSQAITEQCTSTFSKLCAIRKLKTECASDTFNMESVAERIRALLTDRGLLFPQTRERFFTDTRYSLKLHQEWHEFYAQSANAMNVDGRLSTTNRVLHFAKQVYMNSTPELRCAISMERIFQGLKLLLQDWDGPFSALTYNYDDVGYCKGELGLLENKNSENKFLSENQSQPSVCISADAIMETWLKTVQLQFGDLQSFSGSQFLREQLNFTTIELYYFFAYILPGCISKETQYQICIERKNAYTAMISDGQTSLWKEQVKAYQLEDLSHWQSALPSLKSYLAPDLTRYSKDSFSLGDSLDDDSEQCELLLKKAFSDYFDRVEPSAKRELIETIVDELSRCFLSSCRKDGIQPLFMDTPSIIFQLVRSPVYRYFYQLEDRNWNLRSTVENACVKFSLPITLQSLDADESLYLNIVEACDRYCTAHQISFDNKAWRSLWSCIRQTVLCFPIQKEDLFSVQYKLRNLLQFREKGYPILDQLLSAKLGASNSAAYISLWRGIMNWKPQRVLKNEAHNSYMHLNKSDWLKQFHSVIEEYRLLFECPTTDIDQVSECLYPICSALHFNKISFLPDHKGLKELAQEWDIAPRARSGPIQAIKGERLRVNQSGKQGEISRIRSIDLILMEWLILQCACDQAGRELMSVIYQFFTVKTKKP